MFNLLATYTIPPNKNTGWNNCTVMNIDFPFPNGVIGQKLLQTLLRLMGFCRSFMMFTKVFGRLLLPPLIFSCVGQFRLRALAQSWIISGQLSCHMLALSKHKVKCRWTNNIEVVRFYLQIYEPSNMCKVSRCNSANAHCTEAWSFVHYLIWERWQWMVSERMDHSVIALSTCST